jgi:hypothetical protein
MMPVMTLSTLGGQPSVEPGPTETASYFFNAYSFLPERSSPLGCWRLAPKANFFESAVVAIGDLGTRNECAIQKDQTVTKTAREDNHAHQPTRYS